MSKFLIKDSLQGENTKREEIFIKELLKNLDVSPRDIYLNNKDVFENKSAYQEVMEWFRDMTKQNYLFEIKGNTSRYSLKQKWIKYFKELLEITKKINEIKRKALAEEVIKLGNEKV